MYKQIKNYIRFMEMRGERDFVALARIVKWVIYTVIAQGLAMIGILVLLLESTGVFTRTIQILWQFG